MIDGEAVESGVAAGEVLGPYRLSPGEHQVDFSGSGDVTQAATVEVEAGSEQDLVLHLPASVGAEAVVTSYSTPVDPIGPGKARVLVAHTATVAPADVKVDGQVVFANIANGEFATADVPAGEHVVALLPTGQTTDPILGPLTVELVPQTVTMVYAMGDPDEDTMELVAHSARLAADGSLVPSMIGTGSAGLAADVRVSPFGGAVLRAAADHERKAGTAPRSAPAGPGAGRGVGDHRRADVGDGLPRRRAGPRWRCPRRGQRVHAVHDQAGRDAVRVEVPDDLGVAFGIRLAGDTGATVGSCGGGARRRSACPAGRRSRCSRSVLGRTVCSTCPTTSARPGGGVGVRAWGTPSGRR